MKKVVVIWDSEYQNRRRSCFWEKLQEKLDGCHLRFMSIQDCIASGKNPAMDLFDNNKTDIIIINWHAINADPVYASDKALSFFNHYIPNMNAFVNHGGVVIIENQCAGERLFQSSYDPFTFDLRGIEQKYGVSVSKREEIKDTIFKNLKEKDHPLLLGIPDILTLEKAKLYMGDWFPEVIDGNVIGFTDYHSTKGRLSGGYFTRFSKGWIALFFADENRRQATLLCRMEGAGAYILTTIYIASSELVNLFNNALSLPETYPQYFNKLIEKKKKRNLLVIAFFIITILFTTIIYFSGLTIIQSIGTAMLSVVIGGIVTNYILTWIKAGEK